MATTMMVTVSVEDEGRVKCIRVTLPLEEKLPQVEQRLAMRKALMLVRRSVISCLRTAVGHDALGWKCRDLGEALETMDAEDIPDLGEMVRTRYPGYDLGVRDESNACDLGKQ